MSRQKDIERALDYYRTLRNKGRSELNTAETIRKRVDDEIRNAIRMAKQNNGKAMNDLDSAVADRRKQAIIDYMSKGASLISEHMKDYDSEYTSPEELWIRVNASGPIYTYDNIWIMHRCYYAVSVWILDEIKKAGKLNELYSILSAVGSLKQYDNTRNPLHDSDYDHRIITFLSTILLNRNAEEENFKVYEARDHRNLVNPRIGVKGKQTYSGKTRKLWDSIIALIPKNRIDEVTALTRESMFELFGVIAEAVCKIDKHTVNAKKQYDDMLDSTERAAQRMFEAKPEAIIKPKGKTMAFDIAKSPSGLPIGIVSNQTKAVYSVINRSRQALPLPVADPVETKLNQLPDLALNIDLLEFAEQYLCVIVVERSFGDFGEIETIKDVDWLVDLLNKFEYPQIPDKLNQVDPYAITFGIFHMLDKNKDLMYLYALGVPMLMFAAHKYPWTMRRQDRKNMVAYAKQHDPDMPALINKLLSDDKYWCSDKSNMASADQLFYTLCGVNPLRDRSDIISAYKKLCAYDIPDDIRCALAYSAGMISHIRGCDLDIDEKSEQAEACDEKSMPAENNMDAIQNAYNTQIQKLNEKLESRKTKIDNLIAEIKTEKQYSSSLEEQLEEAKNALREANVEINELHTMFAADDEPEAAEPDYDLELPYALKNRVVVYGGYDKMVSSLKSCFTGNISFDTTQSSVVKEEYMRSADIIAVITRRICHPAYYRIKDVAATLNKDVLFVTSTSVNNIARTIINADKAFSERR